MDNSRRNFLQLTGTTAAGMLLSLENFANLPKPAVKNAPGYALKIYATNWGYEGSMDAFCARAKKDGYDGVENWWPGTEAEQKEMFDAIKKYQLDLSIVWGGDDDTFEEHAATFKKTVTTFAKQTIYKPVYINLHSGKDYFAVADNNKLVQFTIELAKETGIPIYHETHRGRIMYAAHVTKEFINHFPELKLTLDISHWCNVHESLLGNQKEAVNAALERAEHIHARVGFQNGPQINDPRAPEWERAVKRHFSWWDKIAERKKKAGERLTILTEFGPATYMPTLPYTQQPVANQWDINLYMMKLLRSRYS
jgi:hypothetical protein